jgi:tetratricopeptide (TPR) repeat protein
MQCTRIRAFAGCALLFALVPFARADSFLIEKNRYEGAIIGLHDGRLMATIRGVQRAYELSDVSSINLDDVPRLAEAEQARGDDPKKAAALYKQAIAAINKPELKLLAQWRAIDPTDRDGRWLEAVTLFLDVYQASPTDSVWKGRPTHFPAAGSSMLTDSADKVAAAAKAARSDEIRKNLNSFLLDIYTKAGDTQAAERLAREMSTGIVEELGPRTESNPAAITDQAALSQLESDLHDKNYDAIISHADILLSHATGETAVQALSFKAQAYEGLEQWESAAATWLRIPAHYASSARVPAALLHAGQIEKRLNHPEAASALFREILDKYPESKEALAAKSQ